MSSEHSSIQAVLFDLDGVLVDSAPAHYEAYRRTFQEVGVEFSHAEYRAKGSGAPRDVLIRRVMGDDIEPGLFQRLMDAKEKHIRQYIRESGVVRIPGAREFIESVQSRGLKTAVATATRTPDLLLEGAGLGGLFSIIVHRGDVKVSKPAPDAYLLAAERVSTDPAHCLVIEDSPPGVAAGIAAGMRVIALTTTEPPDRLEAATQVVDGFSDIDLDRWA